MGVRYEGKPLSLRGKESVSTQRRNGVAVPLMWPYSFSDWLRKDREVGIYPSAGRTVLRIGTPHKPKEVNFEEEGEGGGGYWSVTPRLLACAAAKSVHSNMSTFEILAYDLLASTLCILPPYFSELQARLYSLTYAYADKNCALVVCPHSGRRRLGQRSPGGVKHCVDEWLKSLAISSRSGQLFRLCFLQLLCTRVGMRGRGRGVSLRNYTLFWANSSTSLVRGRMSLVEQRRSAGPLANDSRRNAVMNGPRESDNIDISSGMVVWGKGEGAELLRLGDMSVITTLRHGCCKSEFGTFLRSGGVYVQPGGVDWQTRDGDLNRKRDREREISFARLLTTPLVKRIHDCYSGFRTPLESDCITTKPGSIPYGVTRIFVGTKRGGRYRWPGGFLGALPSATAHLTDAQYHRPKTSQFKRIPYSWDHPAPASAVCVSNVGAILPQLDWGGGGGSNESRAGSEVSREGARRKLRCSGQAQSQEGRGGGGFPMLPTRKEAISLQLHLFTIKAYSEQPAVSTVVVILMVAIVRGGRYRWPGGFLGALPYATAHLTDAQYHRPKTSQFKRIPYSWEHPRNSATVGNTDGFANVFGPDRATRDCGNQEASTIETGYWVGRVVAPSPPSSSRLRAPVHIPDRYSSRAGAPGVCKASSTTARKQQVSVAPHTGSALHLLASEKLEVTVNGLYLDSLGRTYMARVCHRLKAILHGTRFRNSLCKVCHSCRYTSLCGTPHISSQGAPRGYYLKRIDEETEKAASILNVVHPKTVTDVPLLWGRRTTKTIATKLGEEKFDVNATKEQWLTGDSRERQNLRVHFVKGYHLYTRITVLLLHSSHSLFNTLKDSVPMIKRHQRTDLIPCNVVYSLSGSVFQPCKKLSVALQRQTNRKTGSWPPGFFLVGEKKKKNTSTHSRQRVSQLAEDIPLARCCSRVTYKSPAFPRQFICSSDSA
ncbi:hypothetical protein PR048_019185 [Dryococelus australis]|uniref:Uncharacterized protein n=1 Tax=Dryococelus australis TaxID=614101 RepID=A0ABQ9H2W9_9NEOP|nr:hypothetical protein PR048_019185 [Dryococelus australis]